MSIKVIIPDSFQVASGGLDEIETHGDTVADCLGEAVAAAPDLRKLWFTPDGAVSKYVLLCLNGETIPVADLGRPVQDGDEILPVLVIGGG